MHLPIHSSVGSFVNPLIPLSSVLQLSFTQLISEVIPRSASEVVECTWFLQFSDGFLPETPFV